MVGLDGTLMENTSAHSGVLNALITHCNVMFNVLIYIAVAGAGYEHWLPTSIIISSSSSLENGGAADFLGTSWGADGLCGSPLVEDCRGVKLTSHCECHGCDIRR